MTDAPLRGLGAALRVFDQTCYLFRETSVQNVQDDGYIVPDAPTKVSFKGAVQVIDRRDVDDNIMGLDEGGDAFLHVATSEGIQFIVGDQVRSPHPDGTADKYIRWRVIEVQNYTYAYICLLKKLTEEVVS